MSAPPDGADRDAALSEQSAQDATPIRGVVAFVAAAYLALVHLVLPACWEMFVETGVALPELTRWVLLPAFWPWAATALILSLAAVATRLRGPGAAWFLIVHLVAVAAVVLFALFSPLIGTNEWL